MDALTDAAIRYIDAHRRQPFFLTVSYLEPHHQNHRDDYPAPDGYAGRYAGRWMPPDLAALGGSAHQHIAGYFGMVKRLDEALGRIQDTLKSLGLLENTIIVYTSDHGNHFKTRNAEYKRACQDSCIRVPMAWQGPGFWGGGRIQKLVTWWMCRPPCWKRRASRCRRSSRGIRSCRWSGMSPGLAGRGLSGDQRIAGGARRAHPALEYSVTVPVGMVGRRRDRSVTWKIFSTIYRRIPTSCAT